MEFHRLPGGLAAMGRQVQRDTEAASRQNAILDALHFSKFVGEPYARGRQHQAKGQPQGVDESAMARILIVIAGPLRPAQSGRRGRWKRRGALGGHRGGPAESGLSRSEQDHLARL
jgi:hypothetical protein